MLNDILINSMQQLGQNLIFVAGKGGVGKTTISQAIALALSQNSKKTLWVEIENPLKPPGEKKQLSTTLWHLNCEATQAFEEYIQLKIPKLFKLFINNKLIRSLFMVAPGIHDLFLLGKIWFERNHFDHVVIDLPSTGHGLSLFQGTYNFSELFRTGPTHKDTLEMLKTFHDPIKTTFLIVSLPEEMALQESLDLKDYLLKLFPKNKPQFLVSKVFPKSTEKTELPSSALDYVNKRNILETNNLLIWNNAQIQFEILDFLIPNHQQSLIECIAFELKQKGV
ncbi:MAG: ArsA family ATPase [Bdellovibrio sp.]|nr:ArsA family ATPase [Bdellovibrio sp.]